MPVELLIFDFDGLIIDTETPDLESWREIFAEFGCDLPLDVWAHCIGAAPNVFDPCAYLEKLLGRPVDRDQILARRRRRYYDLVERQPVLPGVSQYLEDAPRLGLRCTVASSAPRAWVAGHLERLNLLDQFCCIKCSDEIPMAKPHPALFLAVLEATGVPAPRAVALEDSPNGIAAAGAAGIFCVAVPNPVTASLGLDGADLLVKSLEEVPLAELVTRLG
jgi:HAD superfamily hydrolase (TIGR01509 family)